MHTWAGLVLLAGLILNLTVLFLLFYFLSIRCALACVRRGRVLREPEAEVARRNHDVRRTQEDQVFSLLRSVNLTHPRILPRPASTDPSPRGGQKAPTMLTKTNKTESVGLFASFKYAFVFSLRSAKHSLLKSKWTERDVRLSSLYSACCL